MSLAGKGGHYTGYICTNFKCAFGQIHRQDRSCIYDVHGTEPLAGDTGHYLSSNKHIEGSAESTTVCTEEAGVREVKASTKSLHSPECSPPGTHGPQAGDHCFTQDEYFKKQ